MVIAPQKSDRSDMATERVELDGAQSYVVGRLR